LEVWSAIGFHPLSRSRVPPFDPNDDAPASLAGHHTSWVISGVAGRCWPVDVTRQDSEVSRLIHEARHLNLHVEPGVRGGRYALVRWAGGRLAWRPPRVPVCQDPDGRYDPC
jgi:hypothetical protein